MERPLTHTWQSARIAIVSFREPARRRAHAQDLGGHERQRRDAISETLIRTAVANWDGESSSLDFELRGETCKASLRDTWNDNHEISVRVEIGRFDLYVTGFYYPEDRRITHVDPRGKRELAEKFL